MKRLTVHAALAASLPLAALLATGVAGCGPATYQFHGTDRAVGVDAKIEVHDIDGGNREVRLEMQHLPPPARLGSGLTVYAMWITPAGSTASLAGFLEYDEGDRKGRARATTPHRRFEVRVTAERSRRVTAPSQYVIANQRVN